MAAYLKTTSNSKYYKHFSVGLTINSDSPGALAITSLRNDSSSRKGSEPVNVARPFTNKRILKDLPLQRFGSSALILAEAARDSTSISMDLIEPYKIAVPRGIVLGVHLKSAQFQEMSDQLYQRLDQAIEEGPRKDALKGGREWRPWTGKVMIGLFADEEAASALYDKVVAICGQNLQVELLGFNMKRSVRKEHAQSEGYQPSYLTFPLTGKA